MAKPGSFWPLWMHFPSKTAFLGGNDWGGRSACIIAALWPDRVRGLVSCGRGYNTQDIACAKEPAPAVEEARYRYMYYFHTERGRAGLTLNRRDICKHIWSIWSPTWRFDDATWAETAPSFDNPDFVDVVLHSYRIVLAASPGIPHMKISRPGLRNSQVSVCPASSCKVEMMGSTPLGRKILTDSISEGFMNARSSMEPVIICPKRHPTPLLLQF